MDEPFGAIDPITRMRLQDEFLRLQSEVRKTVVFVTHDIEEAVKMGDRIAILEVGGRLAQYDTPAAVLGSPASPFVADFVGADRGLKRLRVTPIDRDTLEHPPTVLPTASLAEARTAIERSGADWVAVVTADGRLVGHVRRDQSDADGPVSSRIEHLEAWVSIDAPLEDALASMLLTDVGWVAVLDGDRFLGVLTPESVYLTLRRSLDTAPAAAGAPAIDSRAGTAGAMMAPCHPSASQSRRGRSCTSISTRSSLPSSNAIIPSCAASPWSSGWAGATIAAS
jgi:osmoprotectant transport system ATP-binding protein